MGSIIKKGILFFQTKWLKWAYRNRPYSEYYAAFMKLRTAYDPKFAVGGRWEEIGMLQYAFLKSKGLQPHHRLLDFGCGSLRGGLHFIGYLEPGLYTGVDISVETLEAGRQFLREARLENRNPVLRQISGLDFDGFEGVQFDYLIAQSVLTHMPKEDIETLFANVGKVMHAGSAFYATFFDGGERYFDSVDRTNFHYPFAMLAEMGAIHGLLVEWDKSYQHPRDEQMLVITPISA